MVDPTYLEKTQKSVTWTVRAILIDWMRQLSHEYALKRDVTFILMKDIPFGSCFVGQFHGEKAQHSKTSRTGHRRHDNVHRLQTVRARMQTIIKLRAFHPGNLHCQRHPGTGSRNMQGNWWLNCRLSHSDSTHPQSVLWQIESWASGISTLTR